MVVQDSFFVGNGLLGSTTSDSDPSSAGAAIHQQGVLMLMNCSFGGSAVGNGSDSSSLWVSSTAISTTVAYCDFGAQERIHLEQVPSSLASGGWPLRCVGTAATVVAGPNATAAAGVCRSPSDLQLPPLFPSLQPSLSPAAIMGVVLLACLLLLAAGKALVVLLAVPSRTAKRTRVGAKAAAGRESGVEADGRLASIYGPLSPTCPDYVLVRVLEKMHAQLAERRNAMAAATTAGAAAVVSASGDKGSNKPATSTRSSALSYFASRFGFWSSSPPPPPTEASPAAAAAVEAPGASEPRPRTEEDALKELERFLFGTDPDPADAVVDDQDESAPFVTVNPSLLADRWRSWPVLSEGCFGRLLKALPPTPLRQQVRPRLLKLYNARGMGLAPWRVLDAERRLLQQAARPIPRHRGDPEHGGQQHLLQCLGEGFNRGVGPYLLIGPLCRESLETRLRRTVDPDLVEFLGWGAWGTRTATRKYSYATLVRWLGEAAAGLLALHERGVVHGRLCPRTVLLTSDERVQLSEFGLVGTPALEGVWQAMMADMLEAEWDLRAFLAPEFKGAALRLQRSGGGAGGGGGGGQGNGRLADHVGAEGDAWALGMLGYVLASFDLSPRAPGPVRVERWEMVPLQIRTWLVLSSSFVCGGRFYIDLTSTPTTSTNLLPTGRRLAALETDDDEDSQDDDDEHDSQGRSSSASDDSSSSCCYPLFNDARARAARARFLSMHRSIRRSDAALDYVLSETLDPLLHPDPRARLPVPFAHHTLRRLHRGVAAMETVQRSVREEEEAVEEEEEAKAEAAKAEAEAQAIAAAPAEQESGGS